MEILTTTVYCVSRRRVDIMDSDSWWKSRSVLHKIYRYWQVSDRIAVLQLWLSGRTLCSFVNVYAPTSARVAADHSCLDAFYNSLLETIQKLRSSSLLFLMGDFNAKLGKRPPSDCHSISYAGSHSRGHRNYSGQTLADFASSNYLFACNTAFQHRAEHITTWTGWRHNPSGGPPLPIYNQIDYILCRHSERFVVTDARSYPGTSLESDHRLVLANLNLTKLYKKLKKPHVSISSNTKFNISEFSDLSKKAKYREAINEHLQDLGREQGGASAEQHLQYIVNAMSEAANTSVGRVPKTNKTHRNGFNVEIEKLAAEKRKLRLDITMCRDGTKVKEMKTRRNRLAQQIRRECLKLATTRLDERVAEIDQMKDDAKIFQSNTTTAPTAAVTSCGGGL